MPMLLGAKVARACVAPIEWHGSFPAGFLAAIGLVAIRRCERPSI